MAAMSQGRAQSSLMRAVGNKGCIKVGGVWCEGIIDHIIPDDDSWARMRLIRLGTKTLD